MITGQLSMTRGDAVVHGLSVRADAPAAASASTGAHPGPPDGMSKRTARRCDRAAAAAAPARLPLDPQEDDEYLEGEEAPTNE